MKKNLFCFVLFILVPTLGCNAIFLSDNAKYLYNNAIFLSDNTIYLINIVIFLSDNAIFLNYNE
jgi:hypothetical protein